MKHARMRARTNEAEGFMSMAASEVAGIVQNPIPATRDGVAPLVVRDSALPHKQGLYDPAREGDCLRCRLRRGHA